jgi:hypothetical protein
MMVVCEVTLIAPCMNVIWFSFGCQITLYEIPIAKVTAGIHYFLGGGIIFIANFL